MTTLALAKRIGNRKITIRWTKPPVPRLDRELEDLAAILESERFASSPWVAAKIRAMADEARALGATTAEEFDRLKREQAAKTVVVEKAPKIEGWPYEQFRVADGLGRTKNLGDNLDTMMFLQQSLT